MSLEGLGREQAHCFHVSIWSYNISSINEVEKGFWFVVESFSIRWVDIKAYLSYKDTVKTDFEIRGILAQYVAIITPLATYYAENGC